MDKRLLPNFTTFNLRKVFKRLKFYQMFRFFNEKIWISPNQSGFTPGDSWVNQLLSVIQGINKSFHSTHKTRSDFLNISKLLGYNKIYNEIFANLFFEKSTVNRHFKTRKFDMSRW